MSKTNGFLRSLAAVFLCAILALPIASATEQTLDLEQYEGKVVVLDFWASWCVPCRRSFPWLNSMHEKYADDGLVIVGVNLDLQRSDADNFLAEFPPSFQIYFDESKALAKDFDVVAMPSSYLLGRDGEVRKKHFGFKVKKQAEYEAAIVAALNAEE
ncbi:MAG: TlpA disulfide reductase family protein [Woeseiaceae bacterium]|jgi:cytochrome c biogenesis protein CcmG/thiol:disulfide interchange protein DsbE